MSTGMCCICFEPITAETAWQEPGNGKWDLCSDECARDAGWDGASWPEGRTTGDGSAGSKNGGTE